VRLSQLLGVRVVTESGEGLGHVHDVRAELGASTLRVTGLVVGGLGVAERLGLGAPRAAGRIRGKDVVPWAAVIRADRRLVVVRDGTVPR
jgi:sporulation protein YlmC with PRC-barrel domain